MRRHLRRARGLLVLAAIAALLAAAFAWRADQQLSSAQHRLAATDVHGQVALLESEFAGFISDLTRFAEGDRLIEQDSISRRVDALWSRAKLLQSAPYGDRAQRIDRDIGVLTILSARLRTHEANLLDLDRAAQDHNRRVIAVFDLLRDDLARLTAAAIAENQAWRAAAQSDAADARRLTGHVLIAALACAVMLGIAAAVQFWQHRRLRRDRHRLVRRAHRAEATRSRFLSMMSHELRTPMNGVLGMLQLLKQSHLNENQARLLDQAERSGTQMTGLLGDILEYSELQAERLDILSEPYQPAALSLSVQQLLSAAALRNRTPVYVECARGTPEWIAGDFARLRQAISHLTGNLVDDDRVRSIDISVSHDRGQLLSLFTVRTLPGSPRRDDAQLPGIGPETLGLTIAGGLIEMMSGKIRLTRREANSHDIAITIPAPIVYPKRDYVRVEELSETTGLLMRHAVRDAGLRHWTAARASALVTIVLIESPANHEAAAVARMRQAHPGARLVAVGRPLDPLLFDAQCNNAMDHRALQAALTDTSVTARAV